MIMGCYGIGITRTVAAVIEQNYDDDGIVWPWPVAPYQVHLLNLDPGNVEVMELSNRLEKELEEAGFEVLHDDREGMSPGVKFKDAELLGVPWIVVVGRGWADGIVELRNRFTHDTRELSTVTAVAEIAAAVSEPQP